MRLHSVGALLKVVLGCAILWVIYHYVHVYQEPILGLSLGFLGVFLCARGVSYFFFLIGYKLFSTHPEQRKSSLSYTFSLLFGVWVMINLTMMITNHRTPIVAVLSIGFLGVLLYIVGQEPKQKTFSY